MPSDNRAEWIIDLLTVGHNRPGTAFGAGLPDGLVIHSTATPGATAKQIRDFFELNPLVEASAHMAVDWTEARVMIPLLTAPEIAWHAGPTANHRFLSIETCEPAGAMGVFDLTYDRLLVTAATICEHYRWPIDDAHVWSHKRVSDTFKETDHQDPIAFFASHGKTWEQFMADLTATMDGA